MKSLHTYILTFLVSCLNAIEQTKQKERKCEKAQIFLFLIFTSEETNINIYKVNIE